MRKFLMCFAAVSVLLMSCASMNKQQKGTVVGAAGGAAIGAAVTRGSIWGILIGAAIGGTAGNLIGKKMDAQAKELKQAVPTAQVERVGEGINVTFESGLMFKINSAEISDNYKSDLSSAADVFNKYPDTDIEIQGHTDNVGTDEYNQSLSERRASAVSSNIKAKGISGSRISIKGYGESAPKYSNDTEDGRAQNRRVDFLITANEKMKAEAKKESGQNK